MVDPLLGEPGLAVLVEPVPVSGDWVPVPLFEPLGVLLPVLPVVVELVPEGWLPPCVVLDVPSAFGGSAELE